MRNLPNIGVANCAELAQPILVRLLMEPVLTPAEMRLADQRTVALGTSYAELINRAGVAVAWHARRMLGGMYGRRIVVVCGKGNNGNDGRVAARVLDAWGAAVETFDVESLIDHVRLCRSLERCHLAIDAMFGIGFRGELAHAAATIDAELNRAPLILAVDIPSGVDGTTGEIRGAGFIGGAVLADETITFGALKPGLLFEPGRFHSGRVTVEALGIDVGSPTTSMWTARDCQAVPLHRWPQDHKWSAAVAVVGGSAGMLGAPTMVGMAAHRCGSGMVTVLTPAAPHASQPGLELVYRRCDAGNGEWASDAGTSIHAIARRSQCVVIGPGIGTSEATGALVRSLVANTQTPIVVDADALRLLSSTHDELRARTKSGYPSAIVTPHAGEFGAMAGHEIGADRIQAARDLAAESDCIVLLKGPGTVVASPTGRATIVANGGSELATAGTGDALAGCIAAFVARSHSRAVDDLFTMTAAAAWIHGDAASRTNIGPSMTATDLIAALPATLDDLRNGYGAASSESIFAGAQ